MCSPDPRRVAAMVAFLATVLSPGTVPALFADPISDFRIAWNWSVTGRRIAQGGLEVVDLDGDGSPEILTTGDCNAFTTRGGYWYALDGHQGLTQVASSLPFESGLRAVASGSGAAGRRIVALGPASISVWSATASLLAEFPIATTDARALAVADLRGDGGLEAVVCDPSDLRVYDVNTGAQLGVAAGFGCSTLATGQADGDAPLEIALAGNAAGGFLLDGSSLAVDWSDPRGFGRKVVLADFDGDGLAEVASTITSSNGIRVQDPVTGTTLWELPQAEVWALEPAELEPSAGTELLWGEGGASSWIHVLEGTTGTQLWRVAASYNINALAAGDVDGDGIQEILWGRGSGGSGPEEIRVIDGASHQLEAETSELRPPLEGLTVANVDADPDGRLEVATATHASNGSFGGVVLELSFDQGRLLRESPQQFPGSFGYWISATAVAQLDADPALELCAVGGSSLEGALACYDGSSLEQQWRLLIGDLPTALVAGELDGDPQPELLVGTDRQSFVYAFEGESGWLKWRTPDSSLTPRAFNRLRFADTSGDGQPEVIAGFGFSGTFGGQLTTFDPATGAFLAGPWDVPTYSMAVRPAVPGPGDELLLGRANGQVVSVDPATGIVGPVLATFPGAITALAAADVTRDGVLDLVAASGGRVRVFDGQAGAILWTSPFLGDGAGLDEGLLAGNLDGDTFPEILVTTGVGVALFEPVLPVLFADGFESGDTSAWSAAVP